MTLPQGSSGVDTSKGIFLASAYGYGDMSVADLVGNDQATVKAAYKSRYLTGGNSVWSNPTGPLALVFQGLNAIPGVGLVTAMAQEFIAGVFDALGNVPFIGQGIRDVGNFLGLTHKQSSVAQSSADTANVGLAILNARVNDLITGGSSFYDTFGRDVSDWSAAGADPDYQVTVFGGSGYPYLSSTDNGKLKWAAVGFSDTSFVARRTATPMATNRVRLSVVIDDFVYGYAGNQSHIRLMGRMDAAGQNYVVGTIEDGVAEVGVVVAGTYTRLGGAESVSTSTGDLWDLELGVGSDMWRFRLLQNNATRVDRTDLGHTSQLDATPGVGTGVYNFCAVGGDCAIGAGPFGTTYQIGMPDFQVVAGGDY